MKLGVKVLNENAVFPKYMTDGSSGFDLYTIEDVVIEPNETVLVKTGLAFEIPWGYELQVRPRSGISLNTSLIIKNSPGTIDSDYKGEVCIITHNLSSNTSIVNKNTRLAQAVLCPIVRANFEIVKELSVTERGSQGFGSTGKH